MGWLRKVFVRLSGAFALVALVAGIHPDLANATPIIDQQQLLYSATTGFAPGATDLAQTFTVGISGQLDSISILAGTGLPITLDLLQTSSGLPTSTVIASAVGTPTGTGMNPTWTTFYFTGVTVTVGDILAFQPIVAGSNIVGEGLAYGVQPDPYTGGELFYKQAPCPGQVCPPPTGGNWDPFINIGLRAEP